MINARSETVDQKPSYHNAFIKRRCLIPMDSLYEWK
ncbi:SOS response-associated peptidase family protein [Psychrobacillus sp. NPDC093180]